MRDDQIYMALQRHTQETIHWVQGETRLLNMKILFLSIKLKFYEELLRAPLKTIFYCIWLRLQGRSFFQDYLKSEMEKFQVEEIKKCSELGQSEIKRENS